MKKHILICQVLLTISGLLIFNNVFSQCDFKGLRDKILEKVKSDLNNQDSSMVLGMQLSVGTEQKKLRGDKFCDTLKIMFAPKRHFRFYLNSSGAMDGEIKLKLIRISKFKNIKPTLLKEIQCTSNTVNSFDFVHNEGEAEFLLILTLDKKSKGCALTTLTQFMPKTIK